ncbi:autophagy- protein 2 [Borealophlyctis nickersoniae]|nr:autophagy- protein 2 [Borealophlyctis nickersoniae]
MSLQKRLVKFLLKRAIGQFLASELDLANLDVELGEGKVVLTDLDLNLDLLNDLAVDLPFVISGGRISQIIAIVPWKDIWAGNCALEIDELYLELTPLVEDPAHGLSKSLSESEAHLMSSSIHFAENFLRNEVNGDDDLDLRFPQPRSPPGRQGASPRNSASSHKTPPPLPNADYGGSGLEGLQVLTRLIDKILAKVKVTARNINIRIVHRSWPAAGSDYLALPVTYHLDLCIPLVAYFDETPGLEDDAEDGAVPFEIIKMIKLDEIKVKLSQVDPSQTTDDMPAHGDIPSMDEDSPGGPMNEERLSTTQSPRYVWSDVIAAAQRENWVRLTINRQTEVTSSSMSMYASAEENIFATSSVYQGDGGPSANWDINVTLEALCGFLTPERLAVLLDLAAAFSTDANVRKDGAGHDAYGSEPPSPVESSPHDLSEAGAYRRAAGMHFDSDSEPDINQPGSIGGWPGTSPNAVHPSAQTLPVETLPPRNFRFNFDIAACSVYATLHDSDSFPARFDLQTFYHMYFHDGGATAVPATAFPIDMSASFMTNQNTKFNSGTGGTVDELMADFLGVGHLKCSVRGANFGFRRNNVDGTAMSAGHVILQEFEISEWPSESGISNPQPNRRRSSKTYNPILRMDSSTDVSQVFNLHSQLSKSNHIPEPQHHQSTRSLIATSPSLKCTINMRQNDINPLLRKNPLDIIWAVSVDLAPVHIYVDPTIVNRIDQYLAVLQGAPRANSEASAEESGFRDSLGRIMEDLSEEGVSFVRTREISSDLSTARNVIKNKYDQPTGITRNPFTSPMSPDTDVDKGPGHERCGSQKFRDELLILDVLNPVISTNLGNSEISKYGPKVGGRDGGLPAEGAADEHVQRYNLQCSDCGVAIATPESHRRGVPGLSIKPILKFGPSHSIPFTTPAAALRTPAALPNIEVAVRSVLSGIGRVDHRPATSVFVTPNGLKLSRESVDHSPSHGGGAGFGMRSWYDVGSTGIHEESGQDIEQDDEFLWFKQRTIKDSVVFLNCQVPTCDITLCKPDFDLLQILVNDLVIWQPASAMSTGAGAAAAFQPERSSMLFDITSSKASKDSADLDDMDSSRDFGYSGTRSPQFEERSRGEYGVDGNDGEHTKLTVLVSIGCVRCEIHSPARPGPEGEAKEEASCYAAQMNEMRLFAVVGHEGKPVTFLWLDSQEIGLSALVSQESAIPYLAATLPKMVKTKPMLSSSFHMSFDKELNINETTASLTFSGFTLHAPSGSSMLQDLEEFAKEPIGMTSIDIATRPTKLYVNLVDMCISHRRVHMPIRAVGVIDNVKISTILNPDSPTLGLEVSTYNVTMFLLEDPEKLAAMDDDSGPGTLLARKAAEAANLGGYANLRKYWNAMGFANVASIDTLDLSIRINAKDILPNFLLEIKNNQMYIDTCADSFNTLQALLQSFSDGNKKSRDQLTRFSQRNESPVLRTPPEEEHSSPTYSDMLASLDEEAFKQRSESFKPPVPEETMESPSHLVFEDEFFGGSGTGQLGQSILIPAEREGIVKQPATIAPKRVSFGLHEDSVRTFGDDEEFSIVEDHFSSGKVAPVPLLGRSEKYSKETQEKSLTHISIREFDLTWRIFDGYDWERTRQAVFEQKSKSKRPGREANGTAEMPYGRMARRSSGAGTNEFPTAGESYTSLNPFDFENATDLSSPQDNFGFEVDNYFLPPTLHSPVQSPPREQIWDRDRDAETESIVSEHSAVSGRSRQTSATATPSAAGRAAPQCADDLQRSRHGYIEFRAFHINVEYDIYPSTSQIATRLLVHVRDFEIIDNVRTSLWRKFLSHLRPDSDTVPRETESNMIEFDLASVRPSIAEGDNLELRLKVSLLPIRMYVDQDALSCLLRFFSFEHLGRMGEATNPNPDTTFFQYCEIEPIVAKIDYKPKHVDYANLKGGNLIEILNFFHLDGAEMTLSGVKLTGIQGWSKLADGCIKEWLPHIRNTQVPKVMSGVSGVRSLVNLGNGVADLVLLPIEQYKKDGRIVRGLQKGVRSFAKAATMETIKLGTRLAVGTQVLLEHADEILSFEAPRTSGSDGEYEYDEARGGSVVMSEGASSFAGGSSVDQVSKFSEQPKDIKEGVGLAYRSLSRNVGTAARTIVAVPMQVYEKTGTQGTVRAVIRAVPVAVLKPMIGATEAVSKTLLGIQNTIEPSKRLQMEDKYVETVATDE